MTDRRDDERNEVSGIEGRASGAGSADDTRPVDTDPPQVDRRPTQAESMIDADLDNPRIHDR